MNKMVRLNFNVDEKIKLELERLKTLSGSTSLVAVFQKALSTYALLLDERKSGSAIHVIPADGETKLLVLPGEGALVSRNKLTVVD